MKKNIQIIFCYICCFISAFHVDAQKLVVQTSKGKVYTGEVFQIAYSANGNVSGFRKPAMPDFEMYSGPNQSTSISMINGTVSQSITFSMMIACRKEGKFTIGPAVATIDGKNVESGQLTIEVIRGTPPKNQNQQQNDPFSNFFGSDPFSQEPPQNQKQEEKQIKQGDIFVRTYSNKKKCYLGEQITVTQKVYSRLTLRAFQNFKPPAYLGFWTKDEERKGSIMLTVENLDGVNYNVAEFSKTYLFPQKSGSLVIDPIQIDCIVRQQAKGGGSIFEQFFGGGAQDAVIKIKSKPIQIEVAVLPEKGKPDNFSGAVGKFTFSAKIDHTEVKANEPIELKLTISGSGNISLAQEPKLSFPDGFESYEPKVSENITSGGGINGTKIYTYLVIPRRAGDFVLDKLGFSYFELEKGQYVNIPSPAFHIKVLPGDSTAAGAAQVYTPKNEVGDQENDIRFIKMGDLGTEEESEEFFGSVLHIMLLFLPILGFVIVLLVKRKYKYELENAPLLREKRAGRFAKKQLNRAEKFIALNKQDEFYNEILVALHRYLSNKLHIPISDLSKENMQMRLEHKQVASDITANLMSTLSNCEFARYAPGSVEQDLQKVYKATTTLITQLEENLK